ncbi:MAG: hypothetical protein WD274_03725 [Acidimicrobiia bacterium]
MTCKYCSNLVPAGVASCPHCGRDLRADLVDSEIIEAVQAEKSSSRPWLVGLGVGILVLVVGGVSFALFRNPATVAAFSERMPADVTAYFALDVGQLVSAESKAVIEEFGGIVELATGEDFDVDTAFDDLLEEVEAELGPDLNYEEDIASWASGSIAVGVRLTEDYFDQSAVVWVSGRNEVALAAFIDKMEQIAADEGVVTSRVAIGGVEFISSDILDGGLVAQVGSDLLMVTDESLAQEVLALTPETSLREVPGFVERMALVPQNAIVTFASDSAAAGAYGFGSAATGFLGFGSGMYNEATQDVPDTGWTVGALAVENGNIRFDSVSGIDPDAAYELSDDSLALAELPGDDAIFFVRLAGIGQGLQAMADMFGPDLDAELEAATGLSVEQILSLFEIDAGLAMWPSSEPEIPVGAALVGVGTADAAPVVDRLNQAIMESGGVNATEVDGGYWYESLVAFGSRGPFTLISSDRSLLQASPAMSVAESEMYARARDLIGSGFVPSFGADIDGILRLVDGFVDDPEILEAFACNPMRFIAGGSRVDGDLSRTVSIVEVEAPTTCG